MAKTGLYFPTHAWEEIALLTDNKAAVSLFYKSASRVTCKKICPPPLQQTAQICRSLVLKNIILLRPSKICAEKFKCYQSQSSAAQRKWIFRKLKFLAQHFVYPFQWHVWVWNYFRNVSTVTKCDVEAFTSKDFCTAVTIQHQAMYYSASLATDVGTGYLYSLPRCLWPADAHLAGAGLH